VNLKPQLASDPNTLEFCQKIENMINSRENLSLSEQKAEFEKFLEYSGIQAKEIGYDPNYKTQLSVNFQNKDKNFGVTMSGGWLDALMKSETQKTN
jgi:hypothetical protein